MRALQAPGTTGRCGSLINEIGICFRCHCDECGPIFVLRRYGNARRGFTRFEPEYASRAILPSNRCATVNAILFLPALDRQTHSM